MPWKGSLKTWAGVDGSGTGTWDTTTSNFTSGGSTTTYTDGDAVVFKDVTAGTATLAVTVASGGVSPGSVAFINKNHPYTVAGDAITGSTSLVVSGGGQVTLNNSNTYAGNTEVYNNSTLTLGTTTAISLSSAVQVGDASKLQFATAMTGASAFSNSIDLYPRLGGCVGIADYRHPGQQRRDLRHARQPTLRRH